MISCQKLPWVKIVRSTDVRGNLITKLPKSLYLTFLLVIPLTNGYGQVPRQRLQGHLLNELTLEPAEKVLITLSGEDAFYQAVTNEQGKFTLENVALGRYILSTRSVEFENHRQELLVVAGRAERVSVLLAPAVMELDSITVQGASPALSLLRTTEFSIEQTRRFPAVFFDPARAFIGSVPGAVVQNDQNNNIIVNGRPPNYTKWMLEGANIVNPNHLTNAGTLTDRPTQSGGGVNILSAQMLGNSQFVQPPYPAYYGNATSGLVHMYLRPGSKQAMQHTVQASLLGLDVASEGAIDEQTSYLVNGRYSTVGLLTDLGLDFGGERINFYDLAFTLHRDFKSGGSLKLFGYGGRSINAFEGPVNRDDWEEDKDSTNVDFDSQTGGLGFRLDYPLKNGRLSVTSIASSLTTTRDVEASCGDSCFQPAGSFQFEDDLVSSRIDLKKGLVRGISLNAGMLVDYKRISLFATEQVLDRTLGDISLATRLDGRESYWIFNPYMSTDIIIGQFSLQAGLRLNYSTLWEESFFEPRLHCDYHWNSSTSLAVGYARLYQYPSPSLLMTSATGFSQQALDPMEVHHFFVSSHHVIGKVPVTNTLFYDNYHAVPQYGPFSEFNRLNEFIVDPFTGNGTTETYGYNLSIQRNFIHSFYLISSLAVFNSTYGDEERPSRFDSDYSFSFTGGKEFEKEKGDHLRTFGIDTRIFYTGGLRESVVDEATSLAEYRTVYRTDDPFSEKLDDYFRLDLRLSWRKEKEGKTRTLALDIQNALSIENDAYSYYDFRQGRVVKQEQLGIIPVLVYRVDF